MKHWISDLRAATTCALFVAWPAMAVAQSANEWKFEGSLYGWLPSIDGKTAFQLPPGSGDTDVSVSGKQILDSLNFVAMGTFDARLDQVGFFTDVIYVDAGASKSNTRELAIGGQPLPVDVTASVRLDVRSWVWTVAAYRNVIERPEARVDLLAGARMIDMKQTLGWELSGNIVSLPLPGPSGSAEARLENWDGIIGIKGRFTLDDQHRWFVPFYADIGTGESDLTWQLMAGVGYSFGAGKLILAWRHLDYNAKSGRPIESVSFDGPSLVFAYSW